MKPLYKLAGFVPYMLIVFLNAMVDLGHKIIQVYSQGNGIPEHARKQIFRRFFLHLDQILTSVETASE
jgi:K+-sensing histidine kinase KdpD